MKVAFDIDGTLTNFEKFIIDNKDYIRNKYHLFLSNFEGYDVDEMFDIVEKLKKEGYSSEEAKEKSNAILSDFWNKYYLSYLFTSFRTYVKETINRLQNEGYEVYIVSSRKKTCDKDIIGFLVKNSTIAKFKLEGIKTSKIIFCKDDKEKIDFILNNNIDVLVDDKIDVIHGVSDKVKCICIASGYNDFVYNDNVVRVNGFENYEVYNKIEMFRKSLNIYNELNIKYPNLKRTEFNYKLIRKIGTPFVNNMFKPIILNKDNIYEGEKPIIYAPNHRKTLDPYFVMLSCDDAIHWAALKRFFTAEDSIFNNNKNFFLRHFTALMFKEMGLIPVNRGGDTRETIELTNYCLKNGSSIGIFPEGTTNKNPSKQELLDIKNGLLYFSKNNNAVIQPISILWTPEEYENRVIVNYRHPFDLENKSIEEGKNAWINEVLEGLEENKEEITKLKRKK